MNALYIDIREAQRRQRQAELLKLSAIGRSWGRLVSGKTRRRR